MLSHSRMVELEKYLFKRGGKYLVIGFSAAAIHLIYLYFFYVINYTPLVFYNVLSIAGYIFFSCEAYRGNHIKEFFYFSVIEIPIHSILSTYLVGWDFRFMLVVAGSIPLVYYFIVFIDKFKRTVLIPTLISTVYAGFYFAVRIYTNYYSPVLLNHRGLQKFEFFLIYFNTSILFCELIIFNTLFTIEYSYIKKKLISENTLLGDYATYDQLTNLINRRTMDIELARMYDLHYHDEDAFSIIMCDIDKFKSVNDTYGHDAGDYVLKEVAWILKDQVRDGDIVSRWGGEEFLIMLSGNKTNAAILAERIRAQVEAHTYKYKNIELNVTLTLGVSSYHANSDITSLIKAADQKLYRGKQNGRNQVVS